MIIARLFIPFFNKLIDINYIDKYDELKNWEKILINYKEEKFEENIDAIYISKIDIWNLKTNIEKNIVFIRQLNDNDLQVLNKNQEKSKELLKIFIKESKKYNLWLIPINGMLTFSERTVLFNYSSKERIDFRELVKSLAIKLKKRIQLRHVWTRDRSALIWWYWICWRELCCTKFLRNIPPVKAESAKGQDFFHKNIDVLSWACGKLKCCLNFEIHQYKKMKKWMPNYWKTLKIDWNKWTVIGLDIFNQKIKVKFKDKTVIYHLSELNLN